MKSILLALTLLITISLSASVTVLTIKQQTIRPSYPFPAFLSTGPYIWYEKAEKQPLKGHTFRISTFTDDQTYQIFIEKVEFGDDGCCLEIVDYRQLIINERFLKHHFPQNSGLYGFKLIRWLNPQSFEFQAYGGKYKISDIGNQKPKIEEIKSK